MPTHSFEPLRGRIETLVVDSAALGGNLLGDPAARTVAVYLPEGHDEGDGDYPLFVALAGFLGSGLRQVGWHLFGESVPQRFERLAREGRMGPVIAVFPDCFTSLGGNQYVDSVALGRWAGFLADELVPGIEKRFRVRRGARHRAIFGSSSGGYGALVQGMRHGDRWGAVACHSGDMGFDLVYRRDLPLALDMLARRPGGIPAFVEHVRAADKIRGDEKHVLMLLAMAASYDPDPAAPWGIRLPLDPHTAELDPERWERWLAHDPLRMIDERGCRESLGRLRGLFVDCGRKDPYFLHYGARALVRKLEAAAIPHRYEEFDDDHSGIDYRLDVSLPFLYEAVAGDSR